MRYSLFKAHEVYARKLFDFRANCEDCMQKKGYSGGCASCMAQLVGCSRDHCMNQCISNDKSPACTHCVKSSCRPKMKACSGLNAGGH